MTLILVPVLYAIFVLDLKIVNWNTGAASRVTWLNRSRRRHEVGWHSTLKEET